MNVRWMLNTNIIVNQQYKPFLFFQVFQLQQGMAYHLGRTCFNGLADE